MKRSIPSPLLFITAIILDRVVISSSQIGLDQSLRALLILLLSASLAALTVQYFIQDWHRTQFIVLMVPVALIAYRSSYSFLRSRFPLQATNLGIGLIILLGLFYAIIVHPRVWQSVQNPAQVIGYFNIVFVALLGFQVVRLGQGSSYNFLDMDHLQASIVSARKANLELNRALSPDIYVIVLDGYARQDVLQKIYEHDNLEFINQLQQRGFYVANDSHSNYVQTPFAMASFWNFDYLRQWDSSYDYGTYLFQSIQNNSVFQMLDEIGYTTVSFEGASGFTQIKRSDVYLSNFLPLNEFEARLLIDSPFEPLSNIFNLGISIPTYETHRQRILYDLKTLKDVPTSIPGPKIVYAHMLIPHPPYVFDQNGSPVEPPRPYGIWDGNEYRGDREEYWKGYREQVIFANQEIVRVIDALLTKSETPPIIVVMGDHGPASMFNWSFETPGCLWERTGNLYAVLLPGQQDNHVISPSSSPVNTFRVIFNTYFGTDLPLLEDRSYMTFWQQANKKVDITNARESLDGCTIPELED